jgi:hypothetical protein
VNRPTPDATRPPSRPRMLAGKTTEQRVNPNLEMESWKRPGEMLGGELGSGLDLESFGLLALLMLVISTFGVLILA